MPLVKNASISDYKSNLSSLAILSAWLICREQILNQQQGCFDFPSLLSNRLMSRQIRDKPKLGNAGVFEYPKPS